MTLQEIMRNVAANRDCTACTACVSACPEAIIRMAADGEGFSYPVVDEERCTSCGACLRRCPVLHSSEPDRTPVAYAAWNRDLSVRLPSSSGGIFALIASEIIRQGGIVFGARFTQDFHVVHGYANSLDGVADFFGSKYVQSDLADSFVDVKRFLADGQPVLFTGAPCQIAGLHAYLGREWPNLVTQDIICHGVPSPKAWEAYLADGERRGRLQKVEFRNKDRGWAFFSMKLTYDRGGYSKDLQCDPYLTAFLKNVSLRPSCYRCRFKTAGRQSDITLADFWGVRRVAADMDDDRGTSLVLVHSDRGDALFQAIADRMTSKPVDLERALAMNAAALRSAALPTARDEFFSLLGTMPFARIVHRLFPISFQSRVSYLKSRASQLMRRWSRR